MKNKVLYFILALLSSNIAIAAISSEKLTEKYFSSIKNDPSRLRTFLQAMPKGGDLHNHLGGSSMPENMLRYAQADHLCLNLKTLSVYDNSLCASQDSLNQITHNPALYKAIIAAWSMQGFTAIKESGHDHFFNTFTKFSPIVMTNAGDMLAEVAERAGEQHELYLELMTTTDNNASGKLGKKIGWNNDFTIMRQKLLTDDLAEIVHGMSLSLNNNEQKLQQLLLCGTPQAKPGCQVKIRYLYQVKREQPPEQVFAQLLAGFEAASRDTRYVGINMVQPEDGIIALRDYPLHMKMVGFLHNLYPHVHISLHAGELNRTLVPFKDLRFHIRDAIETGHAERIGHGVSIAYEKNSQQLLKKMAIQHKLIEVNLISNATILGITGKHHPLPLYLQHHVPVALSTDGEGILRTNLTAQYETAIRNYHFSYSMVKNLVRNSIAYSFLPGENLWQNDNYTKINAACIHDHPDKKLSLSCQNFINKNEKAQMQWELEKQFSEFEKEKSMPEFRHKQPVT